MFQHGLLVLHYRPATLVPLLAQVGSYLKAASLKISETLYVSLETATGSKDDLKDLIRVVPAIYVEAHRRSPWLDVRVLHHRRYHRDGPGLPIQKRKLAFAPQVIYTNESITNREQLLEHLCKQFDMVIPEVISLGQDNHSPELSPPPPEMITDPGQYDYVCLGGTFDNLHNGHKILLSTAQLKCNRCLTVGVTDATMTKNKTLRELIEPSPVRIEKLSRYLMDVDPYLEYRIVPISDPFGPAITDPALQAIVVSEETVRGGEKINEIRQSKGMSRLKIDVIKLLQDEHKSSTVEENKVSSSSLRIRKLGTLIRRPEPRPHLPPSPYRIGLTGMIASGKSSIADKLGQLGAGVINLDRMAHQTYDNPEAPAYRAIVDEFGTEVLDDQRQISRPKLGAIVFQKPERLKKLNEIIWPLLRDLINRETVRLAEAGHRVVVVDAAVLIEAGFTDLVHQVWLTVLDEKEIIRRLMERNRLTETEAVQRIRAQMPAEEKMRFANVVFCTAWAPEFTWQQVRRAWDMLHRQFLNDQIKAQ